MTPIRATMGAREWTMLLGLSVLWGGSFFFVGVAVAELPPLTIVAIRVGLAGLALGVVMRAAGVAVPSSAAVLLAFLVMGTLNNALPFTLIVWGQGRIASGLASILNATTPLWTVLVAHLATADEKLTAGRIAGVVLGLAGVALLLGGAGGAAFGGEILPQLACLAGAVSYALAAVFGRRFRAMGVPPLATATGQLAAASLLLLPAALLVERPWTLPAPSGATLAALAALALLSTALAYVVYFRILATAGATNLLLVTFLIPPNAILLGVGLLGESLAPHQLLGMAVIAAGLAAIDGRPARALREALRGRAAVS